MPQRETIGRTVEQTRGKKTVAWIAVGVLLCSLTAAQFSQAAQQLTAQPNAIRQQLSQANQASATGQPTKVQTPTKPAAAPKAAAQAPKPAAGTSAAKPAQTSPAKAGAGAAPRPAATQAAVNKRDPFAPLLKEDKTGGIPEHLPPGKAGLVIATLRVDGIVRGPNGMIAIVSNGQQRVYFIREGDRLYDGSVNHITMSDVSFHESGKDPFGKPVEREVSKPLLNATPGEAQ